MCTNQTPHGENIPNDLHWKHAWIRHQGNLCLEKCDFRPLLSERRLHNDTSLQWDHNQNCLYLCLRATEKWKVEGPNTACRTQGWLCGELPCCYALLNSKCKLPNSTSTKRRPGWRILQRMPEPCIILWECGKTEMNLILHSLHFELMPLWVQSSQGNCGYTDQSRLLLRWSSNRLHQSRQKINATISVLILFGCHVQRGKIRWSVLLLP